MSQFELIEDYLTNRLDESARKAFEQQMHGDPQLRAEVNMQHEIIEGVRSARAAELKAMLNNVPISGGTASALTGKVVLATLSAGVIGLALYFGLQTTPQDPPQTEQPVIEESISHEITEPKEIEAPAEVLEVPAKEVTNTPKKAPVAKNNSTKPVSPNIDVVDLSEDMMDNKEETTVPELSNKPEISTSKLEVETDNTNKAYPFHYQFKEGKLLLYGPFDASLYEIIEINGGSHHVFLYYRSSYYHLDELEQQIVPLIMIRDFELLAKLEQFRNKK